LLPQLPEIAWQVHERVNLKDTKILPWRVLSRELALDATPWLRCWVETVQLPNGKTVKDFYKLGLPDYAVIFAVTGDGQVVAERSYRHGVGEVCTVLPAGMLEPGEEPEAAARRELLEETGYEAAKWQALGSYVVDSNRGSCHMYAYLALGGRLTAEQQLDEMEEIRVELLEIQQVSRMLLAGEFKTLATAAAAGLALNALSLTSVPEVST